MTAHTHLALVLAGGPTLVRAGVACLLERAGHIVLAQPETPDALHTFLVQNPHTAMVLIDEATAGMNTLAGLKNLTAQFPVPRFVLLVDPDRVESIRVAFQAGLHGVVPKTAAPEGFLGILELINRGESVFPSRILHQRREGADDLTPRLTPREEEIVLCLARGCSNKEIARELDVAEGTVKVHVKAILKKLNLTNRTQVAIYAHDRGLTA
jgi:two-component system nitrate/nitrite response regulator NarL